MQGEELMPGEGECLGEGDARVGDDAWGRGDASIGDDAWGRGDARLH